MDVHKGSCSSTDPHSMSHSGPANSTELTPNFQHWHKSEKWSLITLRWWTNYGYIHLIQNSNGKVLSSSPPNWTTENSHNAIRRLWKWCTSCSSLNRHILVVITPCHLMALLKVHIMWHCYMIKCDLLQVRNIQNCRNRDNFPSGHCNKRSLRYNDTPSHIPSVAPFFYYILYFTWEGDFTLSVWIC
jgi:hypothetical protein